jgi:hypothetical protein
MLAAKSGMANLRLEVAVVIPFTSSFSAVHGRRASGCFGGKPLAFVISTPTGTVQEVGQPNSAGLGLATEDWRVHGRPGRCAVDGRSLTRLSMR